MKSDVPVGGEYKKVLIAVAVVGGVGVGAGLLARRLWQYRDAGAAADGDKSDKQTQDGKPLPAPKEAPVSASKENVTSSQGVKPSNQQSDSLSTSGTFEKVSLTSAPKSLEPQKEPKKPTPSPTAAESKIPPPVEKPQIKLLPAPVDAKKTENVTMKDKNDIVLVETVKSSQGPEAYKPANTPASVAASAPSSVAP